LANKEHYRFWQQAIEALRQDVPDNLDWLFAEDPPLLRWRDDGADIDPRLAKGWLVLAARRDDVEPTETQRRQASLIQSDDTAALAMWLLKTWIAFDTAPAPELTDERRRELRDIAERAAQVARRFNRGGTDPEARYQQLLEQEARSEPSSALPHRGLLALVAACADPETAGVTIRPEVEAYLSDHHQRSGQCETLRCLLAAIEET